MEQGEMAKVLNEYFGSVFTREDTNSVPRKEAETEEKLEGVSIWERDIISKIENLKQDSAAGPDGICPRLLKETAREVAAPLKMIFEGTLGEETCPSDWKQAIVVPIYKKGPKNKPENYRCL